MFIEYTLYHCIMPFLFLDKNYKHIDHDWHHCNGYDH